MILKIKYEKVVIKFLKKNSSKITKEDIDNLVLKSMKKIIKKEDINIDLKKMIDSKNELFRIRKGDIRIIFSYTSNGDIVISVVEDIGFRGDIYK